MADRVDMSREPRRDQFAYFQTLANPYVGVTVQVDVTELAVWCRDSGHELLPGGAVRRRPGGQRRAGAAAAYPGGPGGGVRLLPLLPHGGPAGRDLLLLPAWRWTAPLRQFLPYAAAEQERVKAAPSLEDGEDGESLFFVSCVPWLSYTALTQPTPTPADSNPRITWGRWHRQEGRTLLPMTLLANHALVDGIHIARFYENLDRELAALCGGEKTEY